MCTLDQLSQVVVGKDPDPILDGQFGDFEVALRHKSLVGWVHLAGMGVDSRTVLRQHMDGIHGQPLSKFTVECFEVVVIHYKRLLVVQTHPPQTLQVDTLTVLNEPVDELYQHALDVAAGGLLCHPHLEGATLLLCVDEVDCLLFVALYDFVVMHPISVKLKLFLILL